MINYITLYTILHIEYIMASTPTRTSRQGSASRAAPGAPKRNKNRKKSSSDDDDDEKKKEEARKRQEEEARKRQEKYEQDIGTAGGTEAGPPSLKPSSVQLKF